MELTGSYHGVVWKFPLSLGVVMELSGSCPLISDFIRSCPELVLELSSDSRLSLGVVLELPRSCSGVVL